EQKTDTVAMTNLPASDNITHPIRDADTLQNITSTIEKIEAPSTKQVQKKKSPSQVTEPTKETPLPGEEKVIPAADSPQAPPQETDIRPTPVEPSHPIAKRQVVVYSNVRVDLLLIDHPNMHERDKTDQPVKFSVVNDVVYDNVVII